MLRIRKIVGHPKLKRFWVRWRILMWKAVLMRLHSPITTALEIIIAIIFSLQIRLMFEPHALHSQVVEQTCKIMYHKLNLLRNYICIYYIIHNLIIFD